MGTWCVRVVCPQNSWINVPVSHVYYLYGYLVGVISGKNPLASPTVSD